MGRLEQTLLLYFLPSSARAVHGRWLFVGAIRPPSCRISPTDLVALPALASALPHRPLSSSASTRPARAVARGVAFADSGTTFRATPPGPNSCLHFVLYKAPNGKIK